MYAHFSYLSVYFSLFLCYFSVYLRAVELVRVTTRNCHEDHSNYIAHSWLQQAPPEWPDPPWSVSSYTLFCSVVTLDLVTVWICYLHAMVSICPLRRLLSRRSRQRERLSASELCCPSVCPSVYPFVCLSVAKMQKRDFLKNKQFRAMVAIDDL